MLTNKQYHAALNFIADQGNEYAGIPMPVKGLPLVVHHSFRFGEVLARKPEPNQNEADGFVVINTWYSLRLRSQITVFRARAASRIEWISEPLTPSLALVINTFGACIDAHTVPTEATAIKKLVSLLGAHAFHCYMLTGCFLETSKRSGVTYLFRRLRPTIAMRAPLKEPTCMHVLAALCLHPIGYYESTWAGCMVPTDEIISHLLLMRGDEHEYWKQARQHPVWSQQAGIY